MPAKNELRKQQKTITADLKSRAQKAEQLLAEIETCEAKVAALTDELSAVLAIGVETVAAPVSASVQSMKAAKPAKAKPVRKPKPGRSTSTQPSQKNCVRDFLIQTGKPMKIAEIVKAMKKAGHVFTAKNAIKATEKMLYKYSKVFKKVSPGTFTTG